MRCAVFQGQCSTIFTDSNHHSILSSWRERWVVKPVDGILQDAPEGGARANDVDGGGAGFVIHGYIVGGKSKCLIVDLLSSVLYLCFASEQSVLCLFYFNQKSDQNKCL
jgi:hypothetical protein